jgi:quinol monooxygenase YgiN
MHSAVFAATTEALKQQPGFISAHLHRGIAGSSTFINYAAWESAEHFKQAFNSPGFRSSVADLPPLFKKVAVPGICGLTLYSKITDVVISLCY